MVSSCPSGKQQGKGRCRCCLARIKKIFITSKKTRDFQKKRENQALECFNQQLIFKLNKKIREKETKLLSYEAIQEKIKNGLLCPSKAAQIVLENLMKA